MTAFARGQVSWHFLWPELDPKWMDYQNMNLTPSPHRELCDFSIISHITSLKKSPAWLLSSLSQMVSKTLLQPSRCPWPSFLNLTFYKSLLLCSSRVTLASSLFLKHTRYNLCRAFAFAVQDILLLFTQTSALHINHIKHIFECWRNVKFHC